MPANWFAKQYMRPIVGIAAYLVAAVAGWLVHPVIGIAIFLAMIVYHAWTSQGIAGQGIAGQVLARHRSEGQRT